MEIKRASGNDVEAITQLLNENGGAASNIASDKLEHVYLAFTKKNEFAGVGAMEVFGNTGFLHTLVVKEAFRGQGFGYLLIKTLDHAAKTDNIDEIYVLSDNLADYFKRYGYEIVDKASVPTALSSSTLYQQVNSDAANAMRLQVAVTA